MYVKIIIGVAFIATCQSMTISKGKVGEAKSQDINIPGRYGDINDDSAIPGRYGDSSKKLSSVPDALSTEKVGIPGRYGDYSKKSSIAERGGDNVFRDYLKSSNRERAFLDDYNNKLFGGDLMYHKYMTSDDDPQPKFPGRYAGDEMNANKLYNAGGYGEEADQRDTVVNKRNIPGRYGDEESHEMKKGIPGRYGDERELKYKFDYSETYDNLKSKKSVNGIPGRYGDNRIQRDEKTIPGRYGDGKKQKDIKKLPSRYGDEGFVHIQKRHDGPKDNRIIPGRYGDEGVYKNGAQSTADLAKKYRDKIYVADITSNDVIPGRYGDETYIIDIPGRYGDERGRKYILSKVDDEKSKKVNVKKNQRKEFRYKYHKTRFANQEISPSNKKRNLK